MGSRRVGHLLSDFTFTFHFHALEKEMATHSSVLAWRIPGIAEPGGLPAICGVTQSWTRLKRLSSSSSSISYSEVKVSQSCPTLCDPMDYTVHRILQARILEWVAFPFSGGIFPTQGSNPGHLHCRQILDQLSHKGSLRILEWVAYPFSRRSS